MADRVEPESVDAHVVQPEAADVVELRGHVGVREVEVRHPLPEVAVVEAPAGLVPDPRTIGPGDSRPRVSPEIPVVVGGARRQRVLEPRMVARRVVEDEVDDDRDPALVRRGEERSEVVGGPVVRFDRSVVDDVVAVVARRLGDGHQPEAGDAKVVGRGRVTVVEVVEASGQPAQVADAVAVRILETPDEDLVEDSIRPPLPFDGRPGSRDARSRWRGDGRRWRRAGDRQAGRSCGRRDDRLPAGHDNDRDDERRRPVWPSCLEVFVKGHSTEYRIKGPTSVPAPNESGT